MADLTSAQRHRLLDALKASPVFDTREGRDLLLGGLPAGLRDGVERSGTKTVDLAHIVDAAERWGALPDSTSSLRGLFDNALYYADIASEAGQALEALHQELITQATPPELSPTAEPVKRRLPRLTPFEKAERFQEVKEAIAAHRWEYALERAKRIRDYPGVRELIFEANRGYTRQNERLVALRKAYTQDEWAGVIRIAHQLDPDEPPEVARFVARAWREVPVEMRVLTSYGGPVFALAVTPDGQQVFSGAAIAPLRLWDITTGECVRSFAGHSERVCAVAVTPNGQQALSGAENGILRLWDLASGQELRTFVGSNHSVNSVAVTPDSRRGISGSHDGMLRLWNLDTRETIQTFAGHAGVVSSVVITPNGQQALSGSYDQTMRLWDLATGRSVRIFEGDNGAVLGVAVTPDGRQALSGASDQTLRLWDLTTGKNVHIYEGHSEWVKAVSVSPNGRLALSGADDKTLRLWDLATGLELRTLTDPIGSVNAVSITPDGRTIVSGGEDGTMRVWTLPEGLLG